VPHKEICPNSSVMLIEKRKSIISDLTRVMTKNQIVIKADLIEEFTEKLLEIYTPVKQSVDIGIQTEDCHKTKKLVQDIKLMMVN
jgi:hypothetical protein